MVHKEHVLLHWHQKLQSFLPPGGHLEPNEDPVQTVLREVEEETALIVDIVRNKPSLNIQYPTQITSPETIMLEDIDDPYEGPHQHIDMIYFCTVTRPIYELKKGWYWVSTDTLTRKLPIRRADGLWVQPPEDVRLLALQALEQVRTTY